MKMTPNVLISKQTMLVPVLNTAPILIGYKFRISYHMKSNHFNSSINFLTFQHKKSLKKKRGGEQMMISLISKCSKEEN